MLKFHNNNLNVRIHSIGVSYFHINVHGAFTSELTTGRNLQNDYENDVTDT